MAAITTCRHRPQHHEQLMLVPQVVFRLGCPEPCHSNRDSSRVTHIQQVPVEETCGSCRMVFTGHWITEPYQKPVLSSITDSLIHSEPIVMKC